MVIGIDLATMKGQTCLCKLQKEPTVCEINTIDSIVEFVKEAKPEIVAMDAPLRFPNGNIRGEEEGLYKLGISVFPPQMPGMKKLTERAKKLKEKLNEFSLVEVYPHATKKILGLELSKNDINDAYVCALTGFLHLKNFTKVLGKRLVIPSPIIFDKSC